MDEKLQLALAQLIEKSMTGVDKSIDFLSAEIPDVIYQLLLWYGVESAIMCLSSLILGFTLIWVDNKIFNISKDLDFNDEDNLPTLFITFGGGLLLNSLSLIFFFKNINLIWLKIWIAPKVWLLDYASSFVK